MKYFIFFLSAVLMGCSGIDTPKFDLVISNIHLIDGTGAPLQKEVNVYIKEGKIVKIDQQKFSNKGQEIDGSGKYLIPGLFDCHVHTTNYQRDFPKFVHFGVSSIFITGGSLCTNEYYAEMRQIGNQHSSPAPRVFHTSQHFTMEGRHPVKTYKSSAWVDGKTVFLLRDTAQIEMLVKQVAQEPILGIKLTIEDGPHFPLVKRMPQSFVNKVQKEADKNNLEVFAHISDNKELKMAVQAGIKNIVHYTGVDLDFDRDSLLTNKIFRDSLDWVSTLMLDKSFLYPLNLEWTEQHGIKELYEPEYFASISEPGYLYRAKDYMDFLKDFLGKDSVNLQDAIQYQVDDIKILIENGVNMVLGTDTGNDFILPGYSLHEEMQLMELGGLEPLQIIKMATINAAKMMKQEATLGSIQEGKIADMIILDKNPLESISNSLSINTVIKNGVIQQRLEIGVN